MKTIQAIAPPLGLAFAGVFLLLYTWLGLVVLVFGLMDARGRYRDYKYLSSFSYVNLRLIDYYGRSYCGRNVVNTVSPHRGYYRAKGYRWYHFLPDGFPSVITKGNFWRNMFKGHRHAVHC